MAASSTLREVRLVPSEGVLPLFYPVFDLSPPVVDLDYSLRFHVRVGHDKSDTREKFVHMPFDFADNPSGSILALRLVTELDHLHLHPSFGGRGGTLQMGFNQLLEAVVAGVTFSHNIITLFCIQGAIRIISESHKFKRLLGMYKVDSH